MVRGNLAAVVAGVWLAGALAACGGNADDASHTAIRQGHAVAGSATGPEKVSTVGLKGVTRSGTYTCSAAVLTETLLVTAAHCINAGATLYAFFGTDMRQATQNGAFARTVGTEAHPDYEPVPGSGEIVPHDVAVVELAEPVPAGYRVTPLVSDAAVSALEDGALVRLAGFGKTETGGGTDVLRYVDTTFTGIDADDRLQIDDPERRGACSGDSGGPLFVRSGRGWALAGVLSGGPIPCRGVNLYTSLAAHRPFLAGAIRRSGSGR